jgi:hypothetical protein
MLIQRKNDHLTVCNDPSISTNPPVQTTPPAPSASSANETARRASSAAITNANWTFANQRGPEKTVPTISPATSLHPCSGSDEPCPSIPLFAQPSHPPTPISSLEISLRLKRSLGNGSYKKVCGFCTFVHTMWKGTKLYRGLQQPSLLL